MKRLISCAALALSVALASPAAAQRPSLIDLQAAVDGLVSPAPATAAGTIRFVSSSLDTTFPLVDLQLTADLPFTCTTSCVPGATAAFSPVRATVEPTAALALLTQEYLTGASFQTSVDIPSETGLLQFTSVFLPAIDADEVPGRVVVEFDFVTIQLNVQGTQSEWNTSFATGSGCPIPASESHLELAGNAGSNLQGGEIEASFALGIRGFPVPLPTVTFERTPPNACYLRGSASGQIFAVGFERLWQANDQFPATRQTIQEVDLSSAFVDEWRLFVESGAVREEIDLVPIGSLTTREFSPADGSLVDEQSTSF